MGLIFISHSSVDNAEARAVQQWLHVQGWSEIFLDFDAERGIAAGTRWQQKLKSATERCQVVLLLLSPDWIKSPWCQSEFLLANQLGKTIIGCIVKDTLQSTIPLTLLAEWQIVDLTRPPLDHTESLLDHPGGNTVSFSKEGLRRLVIGLRAADVEAAHFVWPPPHDPDRSPYPGLSVLTEEDAGIFFGRDGSIVTALDRLRSMRSTGLSQLLVILGASGAGKSSFLRAGLLPRLARDERHFLPLPTLRPGDAAIDGNQGLVTVLEEALKRVQLPASRAEVRKTVGEGAAALSALLTKLLDAAAIPSELGLDVNAAPPTVILPIDQAEELLDPRGATEAEVLFNLFESLFTADARRADHLSDAALAGAPHPPQLIVLVTIRTDSYERLQVVPQISRMSPQTFGLGPMPFGSYGDVVRGPARRLSEAGQRHLAVDERLVDALLRDVEQGGSRDSLPLLSFTLQRLYREHGGRGELSLTAYEAEGRLRGSIDAAIRLVMKSADCDKRIPPDRDARYLLLRRGLIPWLAVADYDTGLPRRRIARQSEIPPEAKPLMDILVEQRLLTKDVDTRTREITLEPAHESLLRQWGLLDGWLREDFGAFVSLEGLKRAARDWAASQKDPAYLIHTGLRLADAERAVGREDFARMVEPTECEYLEKARAKEKKDEGEKFTRLRRQRMLATVALFVVALGASVIGFFWNQADKAKAEALAALRTNEARAALQNGEAEPAVMAGLAAYNILPNAGTRSLLLESALELSPHLAFAHRFDGGTPEVLVWRDDGRLAVVMRDGTFQIIGVGDTSERLTVPLRPELPPPDGSQMLPVAAWPFAQGVMTIYRDGAMMFANSEGKTFPVEVERREFVLTNGKIDWDASGAVVAFATDDGVIVRDCSLPPLIKCIERSPLDVANPIAVAVSPDGSRILATDGETGYDLFGPAGNQGRFLTAPSDLQSRALDWSAEGIVAQRVDGSIVTMDFDAQPVATRHLLRSSLIDSSHLRWSPSRRDLAYVFQREEIFIVSLNQPSASGSTAETTSNSFVEANLVAQEMFVANDLTITGNDTVVTGLAWSRDGRFLASLTDDNWLRVWTRKEHPGIRQSISAGPMNGLTSIAVRPDEGTIIVGDDDGRVWSASTADPKLVEAWQGADASIINLGLKQDGRLAVIARENGLLIGRLAKTMLKAAAAESSDLERLAWVGNDTVAALAVGANNVGLFDLSGTMTSSIKPAQASDMPLALIADESGKALYVSYRGGAIYRWNIATKGPLTQLVDASVAGGQSQLGATSLAISPDGSLLAASRGDREVLLYDTGTGTPRYRLPVDAPDTKFVAFSPAGSRFAALGSDGRLYVWDMSHNSPTRLVAVDPIASRSTTVRREAIPIQWVSGIAFVDDDRIAVATLAGEIQMIDLDEEAWRRRIGELGLSSD